MKDPELWPEYSGSHALLIGIDEYRHADRLSWAVRDAQALHAVLNERFAFGETNLRLLTNGDATRVGIMSGYAALAGQATGRDDRVLVFFAGHGATREGARGPVGFLVPHDGNPDDHSTLIRWDELAAEADLIRAKHVLFVIDACYSGLMLLRSASQTSRRYLKDMLLRPARQVITAGKADEAVADAGGPRPGNSMFTGHLLDALEGQAADKNGTLTATQVMSYVHDRVANDQRSHQTPAFGHIEGDGDFIFDAPILSTLTESATVDEDVLVELPQGEGGDNLPTDGFVPRVKELLSAAGPHIALHDFSLGLVRSYLSATSTETLPVVESQDVV